MKGLFKNKGWLMLGVLIIVFSSFLPLLTFAQTESSLYPYDAISVDGQEKEKTTLALEHKTDASSSYVITLKASMDGKLSVEKAPDAAIEQLAAEEQKSAANPVVVTTHQEEGKEYTDLQLKKGESASFKVTLQEKGTLKELDALFTPDPKTDLAAPAETEPAVQPFTFKLFDIKTAETTPTTTSASSNSTTSSTTSSTETSTTTSATPANDPPKRVKRDLVQSSQGYIGTSPYSLNDYGNLTIFAGNMGSTWSGGIDMKTFRTNYGSQVKTIKFVTRELGQKTIAPVDSENLFRGAGGTDIFPNLETIDFGNSFDTSKVTNMNGMFSSLPKLTQIKGLENWDTSSVTSTAWMFLDDKVLTSIGNIGGWQMGKVTNTAGMFWGANSLTEMGVLDNWDVSKVTTMQQMFGYCYSMSTFGNLSRWNVSNVTNMSYMFTGEFGGLKTLGDISNWDVSKVTTMTQMFNGVQVLNTAELGDLGNWNVANVKNFNEMFRITENLSTLNFKTWQIASDADVGNMLDGSGITKIILGEGIQKTITLPGQKLRIGSKENGDWTAWVGVGTQFGGSEAAPEGEVLTAKTYLSQTNSADTYIIAKPKVQAIDLQVNDAWKPAAGVPNIKFTITNNNAKVPDAAINEDAFGDAATFVTDANGKILTRYMPATAFYDYQAQEDLANSNQNYWPLAEVPDAASPVATVYEMQENDTSGTIAPVTPIENPLYVVPKVVIHINVQDTDGKAAPRVYFELLDESGTPVTQLGSKTFVQPVTGADGSYTIENYYIEKPGNYTLKIVKDLSAGYDPANGDTFTADTEDSTKTLINFGGTYNINVKVVKSKIILPLTGGTGFIPWITMIVITSGILAVGLGAKRKKKMKTVKKS
ncbi:MAG: DUF285 domain-containing protein [Enterococcaceae bacterium]|jgi:surface protein|nr:DUF285 domain-containing protein [Enterococcaceae bacterium]MCI1918621.1 DUF285 domain-containing protein [Enterococcaceae bacterium]